jgi:hypothetical protein
MKISPLRLHLVRTGNGRRARLAPAMDAAVFVYGAADFIAVGEEITC